MSQGKPMPHAEAYATALRLVRQLAPGCERIEIAGSLRRRKPQVRDIEIVAVARWANRPTGDIWSTEERYDALEELVAELLGMGALKARPVENHRANGTIDVQYKLGPAFKALLTGMDVPVDLFIVRPPASWGVIFGLRTGPGDWNTRLVDDCKAIGRRVTGGQVEAWDGVSSSWQVVPTPEEADFFREVGQAWLEPPERHVSRVRIRREVLA